MHETQDDLDRLQALLDTSYAAAGGHLASIHTPAARITAADLVERLPWMQVFVVATTSRDGRPFTGPVDTFLHRGWFWFGTAADAVRSRHLAVNPYYRIEPTRLYAADMSVHLAGTSG